MNTIKSFMNHWFSVGLLLMLLLSLPLASCVPTPTPEPPTAAPTLEPEVATPSTLPPTPTTESLSPPTLEDLGNAEYKSEWTQDGTAPLADGEYREPAAPGSATETVVTLTDHIAFGELDGQPAAAVVLVTDPGGSGTFYDLAVVVNQDGQPVHVATQNLGDRVKINSLSIENDEIVVDMIAHGPDDPMCCPTQEVTKMYRLSGDTLVDAQPEEASAALTEEALRNAQYMVDEAEIESGAIQLTDGGYEGEPYVEGGASRPLYFLSDLYAFGDLNDDGVEDAAVVLIGTFGGSGSFYELKAVIDEGGSPVHVASAPLGDRIELQSLGIDHGQIVVEMVTHADDDPMCCPTQQVLRRYALEGDQLVLTSDQVIKAAAADSEIVGVTWIWQRFMDQAEKNDIIVTYPPAYRLQLLPDGQFAFQADCNVGSGTYTLDGSSITFELGATTLAECGPTSLYDEYLELLGQVTAYIQEGDKLTLNLWADGGDMNFSKVHAVTGQVMGPEEDVLPDGAQLEVKVSDVSVADAESKQVGGQTIFDVKRFPLDFEATYDPQAIDPGHIYALRVTIRDQQGGLLYINPQADLVLTGGYPTYDVRVFVEKAN